MREFLASILKYLHTLGIDVEAQGGADWVERLPLFVSAPYLFETISVFGRRHALGLFRGEELPHPAQVCVQRAGVESVSGMPAVFGFRTGSREFCRLLSGKGIGFVIPGRQCFLPGTVISFREDRFTAAGSGGREFLSPMAQMVFLHYLQDQVPDGRLFFQEIIRRLAMNKVYVSRSARELRSAGIARIGTDGRCRYLQFDGDRRTLWAEARHRLVNPVWKRIRTRGMPPRLPLAGMSALAGYTSLNDDPSRTFAGYAREIDWRRLDTSEYEGDCLELWRYRPLTGRNGMVDRLSLYLTLKDNPDPRIQNGLHDLMEDLW